MFVLCNGHLPFNSKNYDFNYHIKPYNIERFNRNIPVDLQILVRSMLEFNPSYRPSMDEIFIDKWMQDQNSICEQNEQETARKLEESKAENKTRGWGLGGWLSGVARASKNLVGKIDSSLCLSDTARSLGRSVSAGALSTGKFLKRNVSQRLKRVLVSGCLCYTEDEQTEVRDELDVTEGSFNPLEVKRKELRKRLENAEREKAKERRDLLRRGYGRRARADQIGGDSDPFEQEQNSGENG